MSIHTTSLRLTLGIVSFLTSFIIACPTSGQIESSPQAEELKIEANRTLTSNHRTSKFEKTFVVDVPSSGVLAIHVSNPKGEGGASSLHLTPTLSRSAPERALHRPIHRTTSGITSQVVLPGRFDFAVRSEASHSTLRSFKVQVTFAQESHRTPNRVFLDENPPESCSAGTTSVFGGDPGPAEPLFTVVERLPAALLKDDDVEPVDCDILDGDCPVPGVVVFESSGVPLSANIFEGQSCAPTRRVAEGPLGEPSSTLAAAVHAGPHRLALAPLTMSPVEYSLSVKHFELCGHLDGDDHGDIPICATPVELGAQISGNMDDRLGGDEDYFTFLLERQQRVSIDLIGGMPFSVYDAKGQRLAGAAPEALSTSSSLTRTLSSGRYYLQIVGGSGGLREYELGLSEARGPLRTPWGKPRAD